MKCSVRVNEEGKCAEEICYICKRCKTHCVGHEGLRDHLQPFPEARTMVEEALALVPIVEPAFRPSLLARLCCAFPGCALSYSSHALGYVGGHEFVTSVGEVKVRKEYKH